MARNPRHLDWTIAAFIIAGVFTNLYVVLWAIPREADKRTALAAANTRALCAFRHDLEQRVTDAQDFLRSHPHGFPGVTAAQIQVSITNQEATIHALRFINCQETP